MVDWCEHILHAGIGIYGLYGTDKTEGTWYKVLHDWKQCPICGAPRPAPKQRLWEIMKKAFEKETGNTGSRESFKIEAKAALGAIENVIDAYFQKSLPTSKLFEAKELKECIQKELGN